MRYTRYEKNNNNKGTNKFMFLLVLMLVIALVLGSFIFKFLMKGTDSKKEGGTAQKIEESSDKKTGDDYKCYIVQCGSYTSKENAEALTEKLKDNYVPFVLQDEEYKVMISLYDDAEKADNVVNDLKAKNIASFKVTFSIPQQNNNNKAITEIIKGYIKILDKLNEKDIKAVKTGDFKKWTEDNIKEGEGEGKEKLEELKKHISELPDEVNNKDLQQSYEFLSKILIEYKIK